MERSGGSCSITKKILIVDDTTLDKPYAKVMELVCRHWSGKHHRVVKGINTITLIWTDGYVIIPVDFRIYDKNNDGNTKNDHLRDMLLVAKERGFRPEFVLFDSWYVSLDNFKIITKFKWEYLRKNDLVSSTFGQTNIKNRIVDILRNRYRENYPKSNLDLPNVGRVTAHS